MKKKQPISRFVNPRLYWENTPAKKKRKPRTVNYLQRTRNYDLCTGCGYPHCDPMFGINPSGAMKKIQKRLHNGQCMGCGKPLNKCSCKSKL